jgi:hypothetical protein
MGKIKRIHMKEVNHSEVFAFMSGNFLTEHLPSDWAEWGEEKLQQFFEDNVWQPFEYHDWNDVYSYIDICTRDVIALLEGKVPEIWKAIKTYKIRDVEDGSVYTMTLPMILKEINRDRSEEWTVYDETDWREGLAEFTTYEILEDD